MRERILITLCLLLMVSSNSMGADPASECFDRLADKPLPFEIYGGYGDKVFFQPVGDRFGLSDKAIPFTPDADAMGYDEFGVAPLCNGNYVTIRSYYHDKFPIRLTGRLIGKDYMPLGNDFLISDSESPAEGIHSVATIYPKGFVVAWLAWDRLRRETPKVKARLFDQSGKPLGRSLNISTSPGFVGNVIVRGLSNGGFVVAWDRLEGFAYFRVFDDSGRPKTDEANGVLAPFSRPCEQLLWISTTKEGVIDVFMNCYFGKPDGSRPFDFAQRFDLNGRPLTAKLTGLEIQNLPSYKHVLDQYVKNRARRLEVSLRYDFGRPSKDPCYSQYSLLDNAAKTKSLSSDQRMKDFFTEYCRTYQKNCPSMGGFETRILDKCLQTD